jgi:hypothetical protein
MKFKLNLQPLRLVWQNALKQRNKIIDGKFMMYTGLNGIGHGLRDGQDTGCSNTVIG